MSLLFSWIDTFDKYGFNDTRQDHLVNYVANILTKNGYEVSITDACSHGSYIAKIKKDGKQFNSFSPEINKLLEKVEFTENDLTLMKE